MKLTNQVIRDSVFSLLNTLIVGGFGLIISIIVARRLEPSVMGEYSFVIWAFTALALVLSIGLPNALIRFGAEIRSKYDEDVAMLLFKKVFLRGLILAVGWVLILIPLIYVQWITERLSLFAEHLELLIIGFPVFFMQGIIAAFAKSQRHFKRLAVVNTLSFSTIVFLSLLFGRFTTRVEMFVYSYIIGFIISIIGLLFLYRTSFLKRETKQPELQKIWRRLIKYSISVAIIVVFDTIVWQRSDTFFLQWFGQVEQVAFYNVAYDLSSRLMRLIAGSASVVLLPVFAGLYGKSDKNRMRMGYTEATRYLALLSFPLAAVTIALSDRIVFVVYGISYMPAAPVLRILIVAAALGVVAGAGSSLVLALERQNFILVTGACLSIFNIVADVILIPRLGALGAAIANSTSQAIGVLVGVLYLIRVVRVNFPIGSVFRIGVSAGLLSLTIYAIISQMDTWLGWMIAGLVGVVVFGGLLWILDMKHNEFTILKTLLRQQYQKLNL